MAKFNLNAYLANPDNLVSNGHQRKHIRCADGLQFSAQASSTHYCEPRQDVGPWTEVEVGFPNDKVEEFMDRAEDPENPTETVYGWVSVEVIEAVVEKHGGLAEA